MSRMLVFLGALAASGDGVSGCSAAPTAETVPPVEVEPAPVAPSAPPPPTATVPLTFGAAQPLVVVVDVSPSMKGRMERARANVAALVELAAVAPERPVEILTFTGTPSRWQEWTTAAALRDHGASQLAGLDWCDRSYPPFTDEPSSSSQPYHLFVHEAPGMQRCSDGASGLPWMDGGSHPAAALELALADLEDAGVPEAQLVLLTDPSGARCSTGHDACDAERTAALEAMLERLDASPHHLGVVGLRRDSDSDARVEEFRARYGERIIAMPRVDH
jgi:hypothetical protein